MYLPWDLLSFDITGAPQSNPNTESSVAGLQQGSPKHFYHIAFAQLSVSAFCNRYVWKYFFFKDSSYLVSNSLNCLQ